MRVAHPPRRQAYPGDHHAKWPDPIAHAWKLCNPKVPFPPQLGEDRGGVLKRGTQ